MLHLVKANYQPSIAQLVERWTVEVVLVDIHRSLVQIRLEGHIFVALRNPERPKYA